MKEFIQEEHLILLLLKWLLDVDPNLFVMTSTYDMIVGAVLCIILYYCCVHEYSGHSASFQSIKGISVETDEIIKETESLEDFSGMLNKEDILPLLKALGYVSLIFLLSFGD